MAMLTINCDVCGRDFLRSLKHVKQNKKLGSKNFCSKNCDNEAKRLRAIGNKYNLGNKASRNKSRLISESNRRRIISEKTKKKISVACKGRSGPEFSAKIKHKLSVLAKARWADPIFRKKMSGENHWGWKGNSKEFNRVMGTKKYKDFRYSIFIRDKFACVICNLKSWDKYSNGERVKIEMDHIMPKALFSNLIYDSDNCRTLCKKCHLEYGANPAHNKLANFPINKGIIKWL